MTEPNFVNRTIYHADNLPVLKGMNSGSVHLIATDPPFNKNRDFHATPDSLARGAKFQDRWTWERDVHQEWMDEMHEGWPGVWGVIQAARLSYGDDMGAFLCWLGVRLMEMHRVLRDDGAIYLHMDYTAHAYIKAMMDAIFGGGNFRNEIVWHYRRWTGKAKSFQKLHDTILFYSRSDDYTFNVLFTDYTQGSEERKLQGVLNRFKEGDVYRVSERSVNRRGVRENDVWHIPFVAPSAKERVGYPTQKPLALYERIIRASSNPGDIVLDPFAGCATTPVAAERLGREWVGIDIWDGAHKMVLERLDREFLSVPEIASDRLFSLGEVTYSKEPPNRTDNRIEAAPDLQLREPEQIPKYQQLSHDRMKSYLADAQRNWRGRVVCAGCGRGYDIRMMHLDHKRARADGGADYITNRVLLCGQCNGRKGRRLTLAGLRDRNIDDGWMDNERRAVESERKAAEMARDVRDEIGR